MHRRGGYDGHGDDGDEDGADYSTVAPPTNINQRQKYMNADQIHEASVGLSATIGRQKKVKLDDEYFDGDDDDGEQSGDHQEGDQNVVNEEEDEDPLDAFMAGLESNKDIKTKQGKKLQSFVKPMSSKKSVKELKGVRGDIDEEDHEESYYKFMADNPTAGVNTLGDGDEEFDMDSSGNRVEYDRDGNPIYVRGPNFIDPLPSVDHSSIEYEIFNKNFYEEHPDIASLNQEQIFKLRKKLGIRVFGSQPPSPVCSFAHFKFDDQLMKVIIRSEYTTPTPIQSQAIPIALSGRDLIGVAKTGSGKTAAYLWPLIVHIMDQRDLKAGDGPIGVILAPTRELAQQIYTDARKFAKVSLRSLF